MKKLFVLLLTLLCVVSLTVTGCDTFEDWFGDNTQDNRSGNTDSESATEVVTQRREETTKKKNKDKDKDKDKEPEAEEESTTEVETTSGTEEETTTQAESTSQSVPTYITNEHAFYDSSNDAIILVFAVLDQNREYMSCTSRVTVDIVNESDVTVYSGTYNIAQSDYATWTWTATGNSFWGVGIYIPVGIIDAGVTPRGTVSFKVESTNMALVETRSVTLSYGLPEKPYNGESGLTSIPEINKICATLESRGASTPDKYLVEGTVVEIESSVYGNMYIQDSEGNMLYIYGVYDETGKTRYDTMTNPPQVGDKVTLWGVLCNYDKAEMKNAWVIESEKNYPLTSIPEVHDIGNQLGYNQSTTGAYYVEGYISEITNYVYGNGYIVDDYGNKLKFYGLYDETGTTMYGYMEKPPIVGDRVVLFSTIFNYSGSAGTNEVELKNALIVYVDPQ